MYRPQKEGFNKAFLKKPMINKALFLRVGYVRRGDWLTGRDIGEDIHPNYSKIPRSNSGQTSPDWSLVVKW